MGKYITQADEIREDLHKALQAGNAEEVRMQAHKLRGSSSSLGMEAVLPALSRLERMGEAGELEGAKDVFMEFVGEMERTKQFLTGLLASNSASCTVEFA